MIHERDLGLCGGGVSEVLWFDGAMGTRGEAVRQMLSALSPLVSFCSRTEELHYPSRCHLQSFEEIRRPFLRPQSGLLVIGQWTLLFRARIWGSNRRTKSTVAGPRDP